MRSVVVVPTYNERENVETFLRSVRAESPDSDVLVVDDDSPDGTGVIADKIAAELGRVGVLHRATKAGLGSAYRHGFQVVLSGDLPSPHERYDVVISMDVDMSHDPAVIPAMLKRIAEGADAVVGSRYVPGGGTRDWPLHRRLLSKWGNRYTGAVLRMGVRDCTSGFRAYRADALAAIEPATTSAEGYAFLTELVRRLSRQGFRLEETPIMFADRERGTSKMSGRIIVESMLLVTRWGFTDLVARVRRGR